MREGAFEKLPCISPSHMLVLVFLSLGNESDEWTRIQEQAYEKEKYRVIFQLPPPSSESH
jgi:hypothetical protein